MLIYKSSRLSHIQFLIILFSNSFEQRRKLGTRIIFIADVKTVMHFLYGLQGVVSEDVRAITTFQ
jgi:hypothetical protein